MYFYHLMYAYKMHVYTFQTIFKPMKVYRHFLSITELGKNNIINSMKVLNE